MSLWPLWRREKVLFASHPAAPEQRLSDAGNQALVLSTSKGTVYFWESAGGLMMQRNDGRPERFADDARMVAGAALPKGGAVVAWASTARRSGHDSRRFVAVSRALADFSRDTPGDIV